MKVLAGRALSRPYYYARIVHSISFCNLPNHLPTCVSQHQAAPLPDLHESQKKTVMTLLPGAREAAKKRLVDSFWLPVVTDALITNPCPHEPRTSSTRSDNLEAGYSPWYRTPRIPARRLRNKTRACPCRSASRLVISHLAYPLPDLWCVVHLCYFHRSRLLIRILSR